MLSQQDTIELNTYGGGVLILAMETILFDKIDTSTISTPEEAEVVVISCSRILIVCCYLQPSSIDTTLLACLHILLDKHCSMSPAICGDLNIHESSWLYSTHKSSAGTATLDFCESRNLQQLIDFPTRRNAVLDLILSEHPGSVDNSQIRILLIMLLFC